MKLTQKIVRDYGQLLGGRLERNTELDFYSVTFGDGNPYNCSSLEEVIEVTRVYQGGNEMMEVAEMHIPHPLTLVPMSYRVASQYALVIDGDFSCQTPEGCRVTWYRNDISETDLYSRPLESL